MFTDAARLPVYVAGRRAQHLWSLGFLVPGFLDARAIAHFSALATTAQRRGLMKSSVMALGWQQDEVVARTQRRAGALVDVQSDAQVDCLQIVRVRRGEEWGVQPGFEAGSVICIMFLNAVDGAGVPPMQLQSESGPASLLRPPAGALLFWRQSAGSSFSIAAQTAAPTSRWLLMAVVRGAEVSRAEEPAPLLLPASAASLLVVRNFRASDLSESAVGEVEVAATPAPAPALLTTATTTATTTTTAANDEQQQLTQTPDDQQEQEQQPPSKLFVALTVFLQIAPLLLLLLALLVSLEVVVWN